jgi:anthranilate phosphoribosyltransferase
LSQLGIEPAVDASTAARCLDEIGICFMFAPNFHRLSPTLAKVRRGLGFPTIFNCIGPLCNPANAPHSLIGVWDAALVPKMANALSRLGADRSWIVHGRDGSTRFLPHGRRLSMRSPVVKFARSRFGSESQMVTSPSVDSAEKVLSLSVGVLDGSLADSLKKHLCRERGGGDLHRRRLCDLRFRPRKCFGERAKRNAARKLKDLAEAVKQ